MKKLSVLLTFLLAVLSVHVAYGWNEGDDLYIRGAAFGGTDTFVKLTQQADGNYVSESAVTSAGWSKMKFNNNSDWNDVISFSTEKNVTSSANDSNNNIVFDNKNNMNFPETAVGKYVFFKYNATASNCQIWYGEAPQGGGTQIYGKGACFGDDWAAFHAFKDMGDNIWRSPSTVSAGGFLLSTTQDWDGKIGLDGSGSIPSQKPSSANAKSNGTDFTMPEVTGKYIWFDKSEMKVWYGDATLTDPEPEFTFSDKVYLGYKQSDGNPGGWIELENKGNNLYKTKVSVDKDKEFILAASNDGTNLIGAPTGSTYGFNSGWKTCTGVTFAGSSYWKISGLDNQVVCFEYNTDASSCKVYIEDAPDPESITFYLDYAHSLLNNTASWAGAYVRNNATSTMTKGSANDNGGLTFTVPAGKYAFSRTGVWNENGNDSKYNRSEYFTPEDGHTYTLYLSDSGNWHYAIYDTATASTITFTAGNDLWVRGSSFGDFTSEVKMTYLGDGLYCSESKITNEGNFVITREKGKRNPEYLITTNKTSTWYLPSSAADSEGMISLFGTPGRQINTNSTAKGKYVYFRYSDNADECRIWYASEVPVGAEYGYSVISQQDGWKKPGSTKFTVDNTADLQEEGYTIYSVRVNRMPNSEWAFLRHVVGDEENEATQQEWKIKGLTSDADKKYPVNPDTEYQLVKGTGGWNFKAIKETTPATIYIKVKNGTEAADVPEMYFWFEFDGNVWKEGDDPDGKWHLQGTILGGWGNTRYSYFGKIDGVPTYGAIDSDDKTHSGFDYGIKTNADATDGSMNWHAFVPGQDGKLYTTITFKDGFNASTDKWILGHGDKTFNEVDKYGKLTTSAAYALAAKPQPCTALISNDQSNNYIYAWYFDTKRNKIEPLGDWPGKKVSELPASETTGFKYINFPVSPAYVRFNYDKQENNQSNDHEITGTCKVGVGGWNNFEQTVAPSAGDTNGNAASSFSDACSFGEGFAANKTYLFVISDDGTEMTVREYTNADKNTYPKFTDTPYTGKWEDKVVVGKDAEGNDITQALEVTLKRSKYENVYYYDFKPDNYFEIQFYNTNSEEEMWHYNVSHESGTKFWVNGDTRYDHSPIGDDNTIDLETGVPTPFKEGGGVGQNFLLQGPARLFFRHDPNADADGAIGEMWVVPYVGNDTDFEVNFTFWDKGGDVYPDVTDYSKWWDGKATIDRKVEIYARDAEGTIVKDTNDNEIRQIIYGANTNTQRNTTTGGVTKSEGTNRVFAKAVKEDLLKAVDFCEFNEDGSIKKDEKGHWVLKTNANGQPVGLWIRIYKPGSNDIYLDRPYAKGAVYTQKVPTGDEDPCYNVYPYAFTPGNPHVDFTASAEPIKVEGVKADNQLNPGGLDYGLLDYPYVNEYTLKAEVNTKNGDGKRYFPFIPVDQTDAEANKYELVSEVEECDNGVPHQIYTNKDGGTIIWTKLNTVSVRYMGDNHTQVTKTGNIGVGELKGFSPRYAEDDDALTVMVRYTSPGMIFSRSQSQKIKPIAEKLLAPDTLHLLGDTDKDENGDPDAADDDVHEFAFYGWNHDEKDQYINADVVDVIVYNEHLIHTHSAAGETEYEKMKKIFEIPNSEGKLFAAYIGYKIEVDRPEDGIIIHNFDDYHQAAYDQGVPFTHKLDHVYDLIMNYAPAAEKTAWETMPIHDETTWHLLTNPFGEHTGNDPYIYDHNSLAIHIHHLYCEEREEGSNEKLPFSADAAPIKVNVTYEVFLPVLHNLRYIRPTDEDPFGQDENNPQSARRRSKRAGEDTVDPEIVVGAPDDNAHSRFTYSFSVKPSEVDTNAAVLAVSNVLVDSNDAPVEYYTIQGVRVSDNPAPGIYIRRQGTNVEKVLIK